MSKLLIAGFKGTNNSSKVLLDMTNLQDKLYLENDKQKSCEQIKNVLDYQNFDCIFLLGQKPIIKNKISIELTARHGFERLKTDFDIDYLTDKINNSRLSFYLSTSCGNSFCNHIYFYKLNYIKQNRRQEKCVFLHLPLLKNVRNICSFSDFLNKLIID